MSIFYMMSLGCFAPVLSLGEFNSHGRDLVTKPKIKTVWHKTLASVLNKVIVNFVFPFAGV